VELAQMRYRLPRLIGQGQVLSRLGGGIFVIIHAHKDGAFLLNGFNFFCRAAETVIRIENFRNSAKFVSVGAQSTMQPMSEAAKPTSSALWAAPLPDKAGKTVAHLRKLHL